MCLGIAQTIQVRLEDIEGGVVDLNELEARDISVQYSTNFISITPFSYCQKKMIIKNLTSVDSAAHSSCSSFLLFFPLR